MGVKNNQYFRGVLVSENGISYFKINENKNNFMGDLYDHRLQNFGSQLFLK